MPELMRVAGGSPTLVGDDEFQQPSHGAVNVAPHGLCSQSSYYDHTRSAKIAADGDKSSNYYDRSCIQTGNDFGPWWRVDLLSKRQVFSVAITNRGDCCGSNLNGAEILIGDSEERGGIKNPRCAQIVSIPNGQTFIYDCDGMEGRFVTIVIPQKNEYMNFCEVQVFAEQVEERREEMFQNVALNGAASQSSTFSSSGEAGNANDGSLANNHIVGQCSITQREASPWWTVDLESPYQIFSVVITNRVLECCKERIIGAEIRIGSSEENGGVFNPRCGVITSMESGESVFFSCKGMVGRYVTVTIPGRTEHLILCEVQVFGLPETSNGKLISMDANLPEVPNGAPNVALKGASSQSSLYNNFGDSQNSIDGSLSSDYSRIQCSQTSWELRPWWTVDLKEVHAVFSVAVTNREDCCWERINEAEIRIGDSREWVNNPRCAVIYSLRPGETAMFNCKGMKGKYVTVIIPDREEKLSLCEVQVFGLPVPSNVNPPSDINEKVVTGEGLSGKSLMFLEEGVQDYAILHPSVPIDVTEFTLCLRVSTELSVRREIALFSYHNDRDELNVWREVGGRLSLYLGSSELAAKFALRAFSTFGTHICVTWESSSGLTTFWFNGKSSASKIYRKGHRVLPGGRVILGQDQDKFGSGFNAKQSFVGEMSDVHLWNYVLPPRAIKEVCEGKSKSLGNIINWNSIKYTLHGNVVVN
ncbi:pentraxin fusion protein-like [Rana temporaria]|uniref:pentraxin fusion protein-like n=1 Tax=Rana temporaria TaxID=8407 RepID=UPI001AACB8D3|nr:pentraxin fusion protein-like [Rana temporaria]